MIMKLRATHFWRDKEWRFVVSNESFEWCYTTTMREDEERQHWIDNPWAAEKEVWELVDAIKEKTNLLLNK